MVVHELICSVENCNGWNQAVKAVVALATGVLCVEEVDVAVAPLAVAVEQDHFQRVADLWSAAQEPFSEGDAAGNATLHITVATSAIL